MAGPCLCGDPYCGNCGDPEAADLEAIELGVIDDIVSERNRQHEIAHGGNTDQFDETNTKNDWIAYICAYVGRAADKVFRNEREGQTFRENIVKVAALCVAALEAHDKVIYYNEKKGGF